jgi:hypothetical protein
MTDWIKWNGGECPIKSDKTRVEIKYSDGDIAGPALKNGWRWNWANNGTGGDIIAYRITEDHEPMTREQITAQIEALQKQLDAMPVVKQVWYGADGFWHSYKGWATHYFDIETINGAPHIHGVAMKEVGK